VSERHPFPRKHQATDPRSRLGAPDASSPGTSIARALDAYLRSQGHEEAGVLGALCACWPEVVGPDIAAHVFPRALRGDELVVSVDHPGWATQIAFLADEVLDGLEQRLGRRVAQSVSVTTSRRPGVE